MYLKYVWNTSTSSISSTVNLFITQYNHILKTYSMKYLQNIYLSIFLQHSFFCTSKYGTCIFGETLTHIRIIRCYPSPYTARLVNSFRNNRGAGPNNDAKFCKEYGLMLDQKYCSKKKVETHWKFLGICHFWQVIMVVGLHY